MGAENTFGRDCRDLAVLEETLRGQAERVARELRAEGLAACRVTLKLRWADFRTLTRSHTGDPTQDGLEIYRRATTLLAREKLVQAVRLIGVSASTFRPQAHGQLPLLDPAAVRREQLARAVDRDHGPLRPFGHRSRPAPRARGRRVGEAARPDAGRARKSRMRL
jgi:DNA polymerase-4